MFFIIFYFKVKMQYLLWRNHYKISISDWRQSYNIKCKFMKFSPVANLMHQPLHIKEEHPEISIWLDSWAMEERNGGTEERTGSTEDSYKQWRKMGWSLTEILWCFLHNKYYILNLKKNIRENISQKSHFYILVIRFAHSK